MMNLVSRLDLEGLVASVVESATAITLTALAIWVLWTYVPNTHGWGEHLVGVLDRFGCA
jgi:hypothetical protein